MYLSSLNTFFFSMLLLGTLLAFSSLSWFSVWTGLELNLLSFIPLIMSSNSRYSSEAALKYFLIQALGSSLIIFSSSILLFSPKLFSFIITPALLLKLGVSPFHFWFTQIMESLLWPQAIILMTIQKMAPIFLLSYLISPFNIIWMLMISSILSAIVGALGGINQTSLRSIMAFSSINHMAWVIMASIISEYMLFLYFSFYCLISSSIVLMFFSNQNFHFFHIFNQNSLHPHMKIITLVSLLSLGGFPPFTGFFPKWILIQEMINASLFFTLLILLSSSLITLYFYLRISFSFLILSSSKLKPSLKQSNFFHFFSPIFASLNLFGILIPCCIMMF
uniref:NADH-ubiquinone oxidoreductase chain 2 n=1 Tax=Shinkaia crosnieri TaxID=480484 RepID=B3TZC5_SHICR|nr:NADH dehydrogenase subunit 2 [Shinkaia crosnieri]